MTPIPAALNPTAASAGPALTDEQVALLEKLSESHQRGAFAIACDGKNRAPAHALEKLGLAEWQATSWGSWFWSITKAGLAAARSTKGGRANG